MVFGSYWDAGGLWDVWLGNQGAVAVIAANVCLRPIGKALNRGIGTIDADITQSKWLRAAAKDMVKTIEREWEDIESLRFIWL